jgi:hypothetical protein
MASNRRRSLAIRAVLSGLGDLGFRRLLAAFFRLAMGVGTAIERDVVRRVLESFAE